MRELLVAASAPVEGATVRRALPRSSRRMVGPFIFLDHLGPMTLAPGAGFDVRPHPHIGLSTLTYLHEGTIVHRDSLGVVQPISPGEVNWMTAGSGVVHSERLDPLVRARGQVVHGLQLWVALPTEHEERAPSFQHVAAQDVPRWDRDGAQVALVAGAGWGQRSPVEVFSPLVLAAVELARGASLEAPHEQTELAIYVMTGEVEVGGDRLGAGTLAVISAGEPLAAREGPASLALLGGQPFPERRHIDWNFVSSRPARLAEARQRWIAREFPPVPGDGERVPHPAEAGAATPARHADP